MTHSGTQRAYAQTVGTSATNYPIISTRDPDAFDVNYPIGQTWQNTADESLWYLNSQTSIGGILQSDWINIESSIATLSDTADTPVSASSGTAVPPNNIQLFSNDALLSIVSDPANHRIIFSGGSGMFPITPYVVGPVGQAGYQTIQSAVNAAGDAGGGLVYVQQGSYTENLTLAANVDIQGAVDSTIITGIHTPPTSGTTTFDSLILISATDIFNSAAAGTTSMNVNNCFILITNGYVYNLLNWTGELLMDNCGEASTNDGVINNTGGSSIKLINVEVGAGSGKIMNVTSANFIRFDTCNINCPVNALGSGQFIVQNAVKFANTLTIGGSLSGYLQQTIFLTGSNQALVYNTSGNMYFTGGTVNSTNNPAIGGTGAGTLTYGDITFINNAQFAGTLTIAPVPTKPFSTTGNTSTAVRGTCGFDSTDFTVVDGFVSVSGTGLGQTITGNTGGALSPTAGNWNILGASTAAGTTPVATSGTGSTLTVNVQKAQAIASTNATNVGLAAFNSANFTVDANGFVTLLGTGVLETLTGNTGGAIAPTAGNINTLGTGSITIVGSGSTLTTQLTGLTNHAVQVGAGSATLTQLAPTATAGQVLQSAGSSSDPAFSTATYPSTTTINQILYSSATNVVSGLATANKGVLTTGATGVPVITALATDGQLIIGSTAGVPAAATLTAGTNVTIVNAGNSITISADTVAQSVNYTNVNHAASPYTVLSTDFYLSVDCSGGVVTLNFPNAPTANRIWVVKDRTGNAATNNITITTPGGIVTVDGLTTYIMNSNYQAIDLLANSTPTYEVY